LNTVSGPVGFAGGSSNTVIGQSGVAIGNLNQAKTTSSVAIGEGNIAETNPFAVAIGRVNHSTGFAALAMGHFSEATGDYSVSIGLRDTVSGFAATAVGSNNKVSGVNAFAAGVLNIVTNANAFAANETNTVTGMNATAFGSGNQAPSYGEFTIGNFATQYTALNPNSINSADRLFTIGNGTSIAARSDAMVILKNGNVGLNNATPNSTLSVNGSMTVAVTTTTGSLTLDATHYCVIYTGGAGNMITLPAPSTCPGRLYVIINHGTAGLASSPYRANNVTVSTSMSGGATKIISDGTEWRVSL
jgi:trimeric autotransporter adhesin